MAELAGEMGEKTLFGRTGGAATLAVGMAGIFGKLTQGRWIDLWYHFAIMFEALFILTTLDAGTRVGRYLLQDALGHVWKGFRDTRNIFANVLASALIVFGWGYFLIQGVRDPLGGVNSLWPIFGIANQLLASIALCLATTVLLKIGIQKARDGGTGGPAIALVTLIPLVWLMIICFTAGWQKIFHEEPDAKRPRVGFLQIAREFESKLPAAERALAVAQDDATRKAVRELKAQAFNNRLDAGVSGTFMILAGAILIISMGEWIRLLGGSQEPRLTETHPVWLPAEAVVEQRAVGMMGLAAIGCALARELSGQSAIDREEARQQLAICECAPASVESRKPGGLRRNVYLSVSERKFRSVDRCC
jgi:carbon starvation protein